ncbi:DMT family transporter [Magnetospirillum molischianum]|uniref:Permease of the drug/metabolite transporter superfamily n=1 Tax=Magnetospirillum molischianum DSM 120 TaxID=1150626 RepID=H8FQW5_MAGML|nr:EamA family transporter [Magnetospirillum molischianum]CCG40753.1 Permease of the drug/metabolite transporter superfamily [Magnetospirillum molischianum DSM 120]
MTAPRMSPADWAGALAVSLLWGGNMVAVKAAVETLPPFLLMGIRFIIVALLLAPFFRPRRDQLPGLLGLALVLGVGHFGLMFLAVSGMDAAAAVVALQMTIPFSALLAWIVYREALGWGRGLGVGLAFAGVALLAGEPHATGIWPLLAMAASTLCWAFSNVMIKRIGTIDPLTINGWVALFAIPMLFACSALFEHGQIDAIVATGPSGWAGLAYTVIGASLIAYTLWYRLVRRHSLNRIVPFTLLGPAVGITGGVLLLGEALTWQKLVGGVLTVAGVAAVQMLSGKAKEKVES